MKIIKNTLLVSLNTKLSIYIAIAKNEWIFFLVILFIIFKFKF